MVGMNFQRLAALRAEIGMASLRSLACLCDAQCSKSCLGKRIEDDRGGKQLFLAARTTLDHRSDRAINLAAGDEATLEMLTKRGRCRLGEDSVSHSEFGHRAHLNSSGGAT